MDIQIDSDASLPEDRLYVSADLDDELLETLEQTRFDVHVDVTQAPRSIRMSVQLANRLGTWQTLQDLFRRDDRCVV